MKEIIRKAGLIFPLLLVGAISTGGAQTVTLEGAGGIALPSGELSDLADGSASLQVAAAYPVHRRVLVRAVGSVDLLTGKEVDEPGFGASTPDIELWSGGVGVEALVTPPDRNWFGSVHVTGLVTSFNTEVFDAPVVHPVSNELVGDFAETYVTAGIGVKVGYEIRSRLEAFVSGEWRTMFADEDDTVVFGELSPEVEAFDSATWIPVTAGLRYALRL